MVKKIYNWGILAPGNIARKFATELQQLDNARVFAVGSRNGDRANEFANEFGAAHYYNNYEDLVSDPDVDIIYIASPHALHAEHALLCMDHGKPVLCEKALGINQKQVEQMVERARKNNVFFYGGFFCSSSTRLPGSKADDQFGRIGKGKIYPGMVRIQQITV